MKSRILLLAFVVFGFGIVRGQPDSAVRDGHLYLKVTNQSSTRLDSPPVPTTFKTIESQFGIDSTWRPFTGLNQKLNKTYQLTFDTSANIDALISSLEALSFVQYAERVPLHFTQGFTPNDYDPAQYNLDKVQAKGAWDVTRGSQNMVIAVVDNAVLVDHEDLTGNIWVNKDETANNDLDDDLNGYKDDVHGYDVADDNGNPNPPANANSSFSHGTHVAGIASAETDNGKGIAGMGFKCHLMAVKCSPDTSDGEVLYNAYDGVYYAIQNNADVINMSWGGPNMTVTGSNLFETAKAQGITCIASAGNANTNEKFYPAAYQQVMAIGATNSNDDKAYYSNYGSWITVMAPGSSIKSAKAQSNADYGKLSGTSMSAPLVSGLAALIKAEDTGMSNSEVRSIIKDGADDISGQNPNYQGQLGAGRINARKSLDGLASRKGLSKSSDALIIYPNPAGKRILIRTTEKVEEPMDLKVLNSQGKLIWKRTDFLSKEGQNRHLKTDGLNTGFYTLILKNDQKVIRQKLMVMK